ncbi:lysophospholipid acyltransferase family protein [Noviherbaspirillum galbum]|uniref:1-acyl-sn-glycerol-3-phosphate acyltransferase n=1 Tax=Noviherbaspirillum galbum TaxID=2709383 RepID=A0A6B3STZ3_9BURK|nr:lysophospholipid acyltransferase family protein [Noviherbaspirillum galbum]NEX64470.1 1-acyl-sn-glycerol-3-phosphate acyltransferase [Noviherbaspirillum galbum]
MPVLRLLRAVLHLFEGLATCALVFPFLGHDARQARIKSWSRRLVGLCKVDVTVTHAQGAAMAPRALIVSNHVSWLDIFVINSLAPCRFVAKSDIRDWPLVGWLCAKTGTIFISRGKLRDVRRIYQGLVSSLHAGERVAFFPEGTTAAQGSLLPFHANLFEAAIEAQVPVQPYALRYLDDRGNHHPAADFIGEMTFAQSMLAVLRAGGMRAEIVILPTLETGTASHRRDLADAAHAAIDAALGGGKPDLVSRSAP